MITVLTVVALFTLLAVGMPVGFSMGISGGLGLYLTGGASALLGILQTSPMTTVSSYELITIPMFLLLAEFVLISGVADDLFKAAAAWVGRVPGGLGMATALAGAGFGAVCGSSAASAATLSSTSLPAMLKHGYEPKMAAGVVAISGTLAMLLPTSIALILYGLLADVSISKLLISGILPAILVTATIMGTILLLVLLDPSRAPIVPAVPLATRLRMLWLVGPMLLLFAGVTTVIYTGVATPTEASAIGAFGAFATAAFRGTLDRKNIGGVLWRAARSSCMISMILVGAHVFGYYFTLAQVPQSLVAWAGALPVSRWIIIIVLLLGYLVLGSFMDQIAILVLTVPIVVPLIRSLGFDPIWFGVIKIVTAEVGMVTPPVGLNCYIVARYAQRPVLEVFQGVWPHFIAHLLAIGILLAFPMISLWLPSRM